MLCRPVWYLLWPRCSDASWKNWMWICIRQRFRCCCCCRPYIVVGCCCCASFQRYSWWTGFRSCWCEECRQWKSNSVHRWTMSIGSRLCVNLLCWTFRYMQWFGRSNPGRENWVRICFECQASEGVVLLWYLAEHLLGRQAYSYQYLGGATDWHLREGKERK